MLSSNELATNNGIQINESNLKLLSINEARKTMGIRYETMKKLIEDGRIGYTEINGKKKISMLSLLRFIENNTIYKNQKLDSNIQNDIDNLFENLKRSN